MPAKTRTEVKANFNSLPIEFVKIIFLFSLEEDIKAIKKKYDERCTKIEEFNMIAEKQMCTEDEDIKNSTVNDFVV